MMISKELIKVIMECNIRDFKVDGLLIHYYASDDTHEYTINIYELAHKCKEWAFWNDYYLVTRLRMPDIYRYKHKIDYGYEIYQQDNLVEHSWWIDTEPEAIFKACQWILDNKDK